MYFYLPVFNSFTVLYVTLPDDANRRLFGRALRCLQGRHLFTESLNV